MEREYNDVLKGSTTPTEIAEYLKKILPDLGDVDAQEVLIQQESAYEYIRRLDYGQSSNTEFDDHNHNHNHNHNQVADDEALARALMMSMSMSESDEVEAFNHLHISPPATLGDTRSNVTQPPVAASPGKINEVNEQLQSPGDDVVGHELQTSKYKVGSSKENEEKECVICCAEFREGDLITTLPCAHYYHSNCITKSLQFKKACPVCQK